MGCAAGAGGGGAGVLSWDRGGCGPATGAAAAALNASFLAAAVGDVGRDAAATGPVGGGAVCADRAAVGLRRAVEDILFFFSPH